MGALCRELVYLSYYFMVQLEQIFIALMNATSAGKTVERCWEKERPKQLIS